MLLSEIDDEIMLCKNRLKFLSYQTPLSFIRQTFTKNIAGGVFWNRQALTAICRGVEYGWICYFDPLFRVDRDDVRYLQQLKPVLCSIYEGQEIHIFYDKLDVNKRFRVFPRQPGTYEFKHTQTNRLFNGLERELKL